MTETGFIQALQRSFSPGDRFPNPRACIADWARSRCTRHVRIGCATRAPPTEIEFSTEMPRHLSDTNVDGQKHPST